MTPAAVAPDARERRASARPFKLDRDQPAVPRAQRQPGRRADGVAIAAASNQKRIWDADDMSGDERGSG